MKRALSGTAHVPLGQQGIECDQQIQVQPAEISVVDIDVVHDVYPFNRFP